MDDKATMLEISKISSDTDGSVNYVFALQVMF